MPAQNAFSRAGAVVVIKVKKPHHESHKGLTNGIRLLNVFLQMPKDFCLCSMFSEKIRTKNRNPNTELVVTDGQIHCHILFGNRFTITYHMSFAASS